MFRRVIDCNNKTFINCCWDLLFYKFTGFVGLRCSNLHYILYNLLLVRLAVKLVTVILLFIWSAHY